MKDKTYHQYCYREVRDASDGDISMWAASLKGLNDVLTDGRSVFAVCNKAPSKLDRGSHHYTIYYTTPGGHVEYFWMGKFMLYMRASENKSSSGLRYLTFSSRAIGMSRVLDATDGVFSFLKRIGGCYAQIDVI